MITSNQPLIRLAIAHCHTLIRKSIIASVAATKGFDVKTETCSGEELLKQLELPAKHPDICILDICLSKMNGYDTVKAIKAKWPEMKILILTAIEKEYAVIQMLKYGVNGYMHKNCSPEELTIALHSIYQYGFYHTPLTSTFSQKALNGSLNKLMKINEKEKQFLIYCCHDCHYKEIADLMHVSPRTVDGYRDGLFEKLNLRTRVGLALFAQSVGLIPTP